MWSSYITLSFMSNFRNMWHHFTWCFKENLDYCGFLKRLGNLYYSCTNDQIKIFFKSKFWLNIKPRLRTRKRNSIEQAYAKQNRENNALHCFEWQRIGRNPNTTNICREHCRDHAHLCTLAGVAHQASWGAVLWGRGVAAPSGPAWPLQVHMSPLIAILPGVLPQSPWRDQPWFNKLEVLRCGGYLRVTFKKSSFRGMFLYSTVVTWWDKLMFHYIPFCCGFFLNFYFWMGILPFKSFTSSFKIQNRKNARSQLPG